ncbi:hypothetical protein [Gimesia sp.]|uniref:hypothetical protein n=1 Tax=Gimesia sp. TaxID=2024833 RepID=UPI003A9098C9
MNKDLHLRGGTTPLFPEGGSESGCEPELPRDHQFAPEKGRQTHPMFQGEDLEKNQEFLDVLRELANEMNRTVVQTVIRWTIQQARIT